MAIIISKRAAYEDESGTIMHDCPPETTSVRTHNFIDFQVSFAPKDEVLVQNILKFSTNCRYIATGTFFHWTQI